MPNRKSNGSPLQIQVMAALARHPLRGGQPIHFKANGATGATQHIDSSDSKIARLFYPESTGRQYVSAPPAPALRPKAPSFEIDRTPRLSAQETLRPEWPHYCRYHPDLSNAEDPNKTVSASPKMDLTSFGLKKGQMMPPLVALMGNSVSTHM